MTKDPGLDAAYGLGGKEAIRQFYADWAQSYDSTFVADHGYILHQQVAAAFVAAGGRGPVLDIGVGTGLVGQALRGAQIGPLQGTDISREMLDQTKAKGDYAHVFEGDILAGLPAADKSYGGIVSAGTFTLGHVGPKALAEVLRLLAPGGIAVLSVNAQHWEQAGFAKALAELAPMIAKQERPQTAIYASHATHDHADDTAYLLTLTRS